MLYTKYEWAMRPEVVDAIHKLEAHGFDRDLAIAMLEVLCDEDTIYDIGDEEDGRVGMA